MPISSSERQNHIIRAYQAISVQITWPVQKTRTPKKNLEINEKQIAQSCEIVRID